MLKFKYSFLFLLLIICQSVSASKLTSTGDAIQIGLPLSAVLIAMAKQDDIGVSQAVEGFVYTTAITHLLKGAIYAPRPDNSGDNSFPSGHTSAAAQGAAFLQYRYGWRYGIPAYLLTGLVGYSRVEADKHYWRDVIVGVALASGIQYIVSKTPYSLTNTVISPMLTEDGGIAIGVSIVL